MLKEYAICAEIARAFGLSHEAASIALARMPYRQTGHGKVYETKEAARACAEHCERRAREAAEMYARSNGEVMRRRMEMWTARAEKIRSYSRGEETENDV